MKSLAGNSFHLALFGTWVMYVLAHVRRHPRDIPLPIMRSEYGTALSSGDLQCDSQDMDSQESLEDKVAV